MRLNIYQLVTIQLNNIPEKVKNFLNAEYYLLLDSSNSMDKPDVVVNFTPGVGDGKKINIVKAPVGYDSEGVFWFYHNNKRCRIQLDGFDSETTVVECDEEFNIHFIAIIIEYLISFKLLKHGAIFCHASAFEINGKVILLPAWRHVGKTSILLSFLRNNARYISDDWVIFFDNGMIASFPKRLNLLYHNLQTFKFLTKHIPDPLRSFVEFVNYANEGFIDLNEEMIDFLQKQIRIRLDVKGVFGQQEMIKKQAIDAIFFMSREIDYGKDSSDVSVLPISEEHLTTRIIESVIFEQIHFHSLYQSYKILWGKTNELLETRFEKMNQIFGSGVKCCKHLYEAKFLNKLDPEMLQSEILKKMH